MRALAPTRSSRANTIKNPPRRASSAGKQGKADRTQTDHLKPAGQLARSLASLGLLPLVTVQPSAQNRETTESGSLPAAVPDRSRRMVVEPFAPHRLRAALVVNRHLKVIAKREAIALRPDIAIPRHIARKPRFR